MVDICVIGAGPAGLMAAETAIDAGYSVLIVDAKPTFARKFLMAGKSGLNITKNESFEKFCSEFGSAENWLRPMLVDFSNKDTAQWAEGLGQEVFTGTSNRVFPKAMKASPLLRAWLSRLKDGGAKFQTRWKWNGWVGEALSFKSIEGPKILEPRVTILALGGASWPDLGSDGNWKKILEERMVEVADFLPSNMGFQIDWSDHMEKHFGEPIKSVQVRAGKDTALGDFVISKSGIQGSAIYSVSKAMRNGELLSVDLIPDVKKETLEKRMSSISKKASNATVLRKVLRISGAKLSLFNEFARGSNRQEIINNAKSLKIPVNGPNDLSRAISSAGGVPKTELTEGLMLKKIPNVFCAGEMLDWEAPTGGYLITASMASGKWAAKHALELLTS